MNRAMVFTILALSFTISSYADIPNTLNFQGRLMDQAGQPVNNGQYAVTFRLYAAANGGNMVWEEGQSVTSSNGYFNTVLGNTVALTPAMFTQPLWVAIQIEHNAEMTPRQKVSTAAYAMNVADGAITAKKLSFDATLPIGTIMAWHKSQTHTPKALPAQWVECNGQVINDTESPYNGDTMPNLNGPAKTNCSGYFLRGSDTSGTMQNDDLLSHSHTYSAPGGGTAGSGGTSVIQYGYNTQTSTFPATDGLETRPSNMSVVWIMKIK